MQREALETCICGADLLASFPGSDSYGIVRSRPGHPWGNLVFHVGQRRYIRRRWAEHRAACAQRIERNGFDFTAVRHAAFAAHFLGYREVYARVVNGILYKAPSATELEGLAGAGPADAAGPGWSVVRGRKGGW